MLKAILPAALLSLSLLHQACAYEIDRAMENFSEDAADCVAYYMYIQSFAQQSATAQHSKKWQAAADSYKDTISYSYAVLGIAMAGKPQKFLEAKVALHIQNLGKILTDEGMDRLMFLYEDQCKTIMENPKQRIQYWVEKR